MGIKYLMVIVGLWPLLFWSCKSDPTVVDSCGDGFLDPGEQCDGDVGENSCASLGHYNLQGTLACRSDCQYDLTSCGGKCGDGNTDSADGEKCDGDDLHGASCQSLGSSGGNLACTSDCQFDVTNCTNICGNGLLEGEEACDDTNTANHDGCSSGCTIETGWECTPGNSSVCTPICGDSLIRGNEVCDGLELGGATCVNLGYYAGTLSCGLDCLFELAACETAGRCGDGTLQYEHGEVCDGENLDETDCVDQGYYGGALACAANCQSFSETNCVGRCGDNTAQTDDGEMCDGSDLAGNSCVSLGYHGGALTCNTACDGFDLSSCISVGRCGDNILQPAFGEECEGGNLNGATCQSLGQYAGSLVCDANCHYDISSCGGVCGDGSVQSAFGEQCDGANLNAQSCTSRNWYGGTLACQSSCAFDETSCAAVGRCGDNTIQATYAEVCDGTNLNGQSCITRGYYGGALGCAANCQSYNESPCAAVGRCGDGSIQSTYGEQCDGSNLAGVTCGTLGYYTGTLSCNTSCQRNTSACQYRCGDALVQTAYGEQCDGSNLNGATCATVGQRPGTLTCTAGCLFNASGCGGSCGDGVIQSSYEQCDGTNLNGQTCLTLGYFGGSLSCNSCSFNVGSCLTVVQVAAGGAHTCALLSDGMVRCWGSNYYGQLGNGTTVDSLRPVVVSGLSGAVAISLGNGHSCARLSNGTIQCWGRGSNGRLGNNSTVNSSTPVQVSNITTALSISLGSAHSCAVLSNLTVQCWGNNGNGQLGDGTTTDRTIPVTVTGLSNAGNVAAGTGHTCARLITNVVRCWGGNTFGQLGDGTTTSSFSSVAVSGLTNATQISTFGNHNCARRSDGTVRCWGNNGSGQLGDGTTTNRSTPVAVTGLSAVTSVTAGHSGATGNGHSCAQLTDGTVRCWGLGSDGQLGNNSTSNSSSPVTVTGLGGISSLSGGDRSTCAVGDTSKAIFCWGRNDYGQLGDNTTTNRLTYVEVIP